MDGRLEFEDIKSAIKDKGALIVHKEKQVKVQTEMGITIGVRVKKFKL